MFSHFSSFFLTLSSCSRAFFIWFNFVSIWNSHLQYFMCRSVLYSAFSEFCRWIANERAMLNNLKAFVRSQIVTTRQNANKSQKVNWKPILIAVEREWEKCKERMSGVGGQACERGKRIRKGTRNEFKLRSSSRSLSLTLAWLFFIWFNVAAFFRSYWWQWQYNLIQTADTF